MYPTRHAFSYSYLLVGIPIGWRGSISSLLSIDNDACPADGEQTLRKRRTWYTVDGDNYLNRGKSHDGLQRRLEQYLRSQGVDPKEYPKAFLVTAPQFLGYHFNPVSFWYLYDESGEHKAMIVEVNNTFDERRIYFLEVTPASSNTSQHVTSPDVSTASHATPSFNATISNSSDGHTRVFRSTWPKDFHVSPFNSRDGRYSLIARDPLKPSQNIFSSINNNLTLTSVKGNVILVASVFSTDSPIDPADLTNWAAFGLIASWWWVGFVTFPRIVREAGKLFLKRKLGINLYYRPEIKPESHARLETGPERVIEAFFFDFLRHQVQQSDIPLTINYTPALRCNPHSYTLDTRSAISSTAPAQQLVIKILTPAFYSRLVQYDDVISALSSESFKARDENRTAFVSSPTFLISLLTSPSSISGALHLHLHNTTLSSLSWSFVRHFRSRPSAPAYPPTPPDEPPPLPSSNRASTTLDSFVQHHSLQNSSVGAYDHDYKIALMRIFLTDSFTRGSDPLFLAVAFLMEHSLKALCVYQSCLAWRRKTSNGTLGLSPLTLAAYTLCIVLVIHRVTRRSRRGTRAGKGREAFRVDKATASNVSSESITTLSRCGV